MTTDSAPTRQPDVWRKSMAGLAILAAVVLSMLNHSEITAETWTYWFFGRVLAEGGGFIVHGRSPLYTLYLNGFSWLGYPTSVSVEYLVTTLFTTVCLAVLFRRFLRLGPAVFAAILWIPFLQVIAEPPTQKLALALTSLGVAVRMGSTGSRSGLAVSYALLALAPQFRALNFVPLIVFAAWDIVKLLRQGGPGTLLAAVRPRRTDWPVALVVILVAGFVAFQSAHPWNNVWAASTAWFPNKGKSIGEAVFFQDFNRTYILDKYGSFRDRDFYVTNRELFGDAQTVPDAVRANPRFVFWRIASTVWRSPSAVISLTELGRLRSFIPLPVIVLLGCIAILYGALRASKNETLVLLVIASLLQVGAAAMLKADPRVFYIMIPTLVLSAAWYGARLQAACAAAAGRYASKKPVQAGFLFLKWLAIPLMLVLLGNSSRWVTVMGAVADDVRQGQVRILEQREPPSMKASFTELRPLIRDCKGIMSAEHTFIGAFTDVPLDRIYDIWEIPPVGRLGDPGYDGLRPDRIDCVLVSATLATVIGEATNFQVRYENHVRPYARELQKMGARTYDIPEYGQLIKLAN